MDASVYRTRNNYDMHVGHVCKPSLVNHAHQKVQQYPLYIKKFLRISLGVLTYKTIFR